MKNLHYSVYCITVCSVTAELDPKTARRAAAKAHLLQAFEAARHTLALDRDDVASILPDLLDRMLSGSDTAPPENAVPLNQAPESWQHRDLNRRENPTQFVRRVYAPYIGHGLTRPLMRQLDPHLYRALTVWEVRHPADRMVELPTLSQLIDDKIRALALHTSPDQLRKLAQTMYRRSRKHGSNFSL